MKAATAVAMLTFLAASASAEPFFDTQKTGGAASSSAQGGKAVDYNTGGNGGAQTSSGGNTKGANINVPIDQRTNYSPSFTGSGIIGPLTINNQASPYIKADVTSKGNGNMQSFGSSVQGAKGGGAKSKAKGGKARRAVSTADGNELFLVVKREPAFFGGDSKGGDGKSHSEAGAGRSTATGSGNGGKQTSSGGNTEGAKIIMPMTNVGHAKTHIEASVKGEGGTMKSDGGIKQGSVGGGSTSSAKGGGSSASADFSFSPSLSLPFPLAKRDSFLSGRYKEGGNRGYNGDNEMGANVMKREPGLFGGDSKGGDGKSHSKAGDSTSTSSGSGNGGKQTSSGGKTAGAKIFMPMTNIGQADTTVHATVEGKGGTMQSTGGIKQGGVGGGSTSSATGGGSSASAGFSFSPSLALPFPLARRDPLFSVHHKGGHGMPPRVDYHPSMHMEPEHTMQSSRLVSLGRGGGSSATNRFSSLALPPLLVKKSGVYSAANGDVILVKRYAPGAYEARAQAEE